MEARRNTVQRQLIYNAVKELDIHATAEQVVAHLAETHPAIGRATIYRNLGQMADSGELLRAGTFYGATHYDHNCHEHYHFVCNECRRVFDVEGSAKSIFESFKGAEEFEVRDIQISFSGFCRECM